MAGYIEQMGNQLALNINGDRFLAYPTTNGGTWIINGTGDPGPDPDPDNPADPTFDWPFDPNTYVSSEYGPRDGRVHQGIDLAPGGGTAIPAANDGIVYAAYYHSGFGNHIILDHGIWGSVRLFTLYAHMENPSPFGEGASVNKGDTVGTVGNTGASFGAHLHWETHVSGGGGPTWTNPGTHQNPRTFMGVYG